MTTTVTIVPPCPPHQWSHAPTVGYFYCDRCRTRIEHSDPRYAATQAEYFAAAVPTPTPNPRVHHGAKRPDGTDGSRR